VHNTTRPCTSSTTDPQHVVAELAAECHVLQPARSVLFLYFTMMHLYITKPTHPQHVVAEVAAARHVCQLYMLYNAV
jgi:hypothetical protein